MPAVHTSRENTPPFLRHFVEFSSMFSSHCVYVHVRRYTWSSLDSSRRNVYERSGEERGGSRRKSKTRNTATREEPGITGGERGEVLEDDGSRRKREASATTAFSFFPPFPLTHNTIRRLRLLRWILKDLPEIITFSFSFIFILLLLFQGRARSGWMRARARGSVRSPRVHDLLVCVRMCVRVTCRVRRYLRIRVHLVPG